MTKFEEKLADPGSTGKMAIEKQGIVVDATIMDRHTYITLSLSAAVCCIFGLSHYYCHFAAIFQVNLDYFVPLFPPSLSVPASRCLHLK